MKKIKAKRPSRGVGLMQYVWLLGAHAIAGCIYGRTTARKREVGRKEGREAKEKEGMEEGKEGRGDGIREKGRERRRDGGRRKGEKEAGLKERNRERKEARKQERKDRVDRDEMRNVNCVLHTRNSSNTNKQTHWSGGNIKKTS